MGTIISGVQFKQLKIIAEKNGSVLHGLKKSENSFLKFGEAYFSSVKHNNIKGWKKHLKMNLNLIVPHGEILFVLYDDRKASTTFGMFNEFKLSIQNYSRLTIPPNIWVAFKGIGKEKNLLLNIADLEHDKQEIQRCSLDKIRYEW